ncbi:MAG: ParA family protein, partial [Opitutus sp.]
YGPLHGEGSAVGMITPTAYEHLAIIPSEEDLAAAEIELAQMDNYLAKLQGVLEPLRISGGYRVIIIDCPPALGLLSMNSLAAADFLLIALQCEYLALEGLGQILRNVQRLKDAHVNDRLELGGIVMTMFDLRTNLSRQVVDEVKQHLPDKIFNTVIPRTVRLSEAPSFGKPIFAYDPTNPGATAYRNLATEVIARFGLGSR